MHNGTIMQFFIFIVVENSILGNPYSDYLEIFWFNVFTHYTYTNWLKLVILYKNQKIAEKEKNTYVVSLVIQVKYLPNILKALIY